MLITYRWPIVCRNRQSGPAVSTSKRLLHLKFAGKVNDPEPLSANSPLWNMKNVSVTPHITGLSTHYNDRIVDLLCENLRRYLNGEPLLNLVQGELGY